MIVDNFGKATCPKCNEKKFLSEFYKKDKTCKECRKARVRANRKDKVEYYRQYDRVRYRKAKLSGDEDAMKKYRPDPKTDASRAVKRRWYERNKYKAKAQHLARQAVKNGAIEKSTVCEICECTCDPQAHHSDYRKPLHVHWLCSTCHGRVHSVLNSVRRHFGDDAHHILPEVIYGT